MLMMPRTVTFDDSYPSAPHEAKVGKSRCCYDPSIDPRLDSNVPRKDTAQTNYRDALLFAQKSWDLRMFILRNLRKVMILQ